MNADDDGWMNGFFTRRRKRRGGGGGGGGGFSSGGGLFNGGRGWTKPKEKQPNAQPQVGQLWFRQAKYNIKAALVEKENCTTPDGDKGMNWICYKCHVVGWILIFLYYTC